MKRIYGAAILCGLLIALAMTAQTPVFFGGGGGGGGGGGCGTSFTKNALIKASTSSTCGDSHVSDDGTTVTSTLPFVAPMFDFHVNACTSYASSTCSVSASKTITIAAGTWGLDSQGPNTGTLAATMSAALTALSGGTGIFYCYIPDTGAMTCQYPNTLTPTWGTVTGITFAAVVSPGFPSANVFRVATIGVDSGTTNFWTVATDMRHTNSNVSISAGTGITISCSSGACLHSIDTAVVPQLGGTNAFTGIMDSGAASRTAPAKVATSDPGTCTIGDLLFRSDLSAGANIKGCTATNTWTLQGGGSTTPATGGGDFLFGTPSYTNSGAGATLNPAGVAHGGSGWSFVNKFSTSKSINYVITTGGAGGTAVLFGIFSVNTSTSKPATALCVSTVGSGTNATGTGAKSLAWLSGTNVSGGVCSLTIGSAYALVATSDSTTLAVETYGDPSHFAIQNVTNIARAGYDATGNISTGSGVSLAFQAMSGVTFTALPDGSTNFQPVIYLEN